MKYRPNCFPGVDLGSCDNIADDQIKINLPRHQNTDLRKRSKFPSSMIAA